MVERVIASGRPLLVIEPKTGFVPFDLAAVWAHRELLYFLATRDLKVRYSQTALGVTWALVQPVVPMLVFTLFLGRFAGVPSDGMPYALFVLAGLLPWTYMANAITSSATSIVGNASLVTKVYFPRMIIPASAVVVALVDFFIGCTALGLLLAWYRIPVHAGMVMLPVLVAIATVLALGLGIFCAGLTVRYRDLRHALPVLIQFWMFATPIVFPSSVVPARWRWALALNPLTGIIENFRAALFGRPVAWIPLITSAAIACAVLVIGAYSFRQLERSFADTI
jgi:lipopolysaccharide transport system permease protein